MKLFKTRPKAKLKIGQHFLGTKISATAEGYVIYKEYNQTDGKYYFWEEWELRGFNDYDSWIEYDHYSRVITLYQPVKIPQNLNAYDMTKDQHVALTLNGVVTTGIVKEVGVGTAVRREGTLTHHVFEGDTVAYAEIRTRQGILSVENYNEKEKDYYLGKVLSRKEQKQMLGRVVAPINWGTVGVVALVFGILGIGFAGAMTPQYQTYCTPRTVTPPPATQPVNPQPTPPRPSGALPAGFLSQFAATQPLQPPAVQPQPAPGDELVSQDDTQSCYRRTIHGGGGSGVGK